MKKNFIKVVENFTCQNCGKKVKGSGYTNHCPECLWSLHVDEVIPGDRESVCKGLMRPIRVEMEKGEKILIHKCLQCGKETRNKTTKEDSLDEILKLI